MMPKNARKKIFQLIMDQPPGTRMGAREMARQTGLQYGQLWNALRWLARRNLIRCEGKSKQGWVVIQHIPYCWEHGIPLIDGKYCDKCSRRKEQS